MTDAKDPQTMDNLLRDYGDSGLRRIVRQAQRLGVIDKIVKQCLPETLRSHCHAAQMTATHLTLLVDSAAWLTQLRYLKPQLLQDLRKNPQCGYLQDIQCRIQPVQWIEENSEKRPKGQTLSAGNKELLQSAAETISNPLLKTALLKLSR